MLTTWISILISGLIMGTIYALLAGGLTLIWVGWQFDVPEGPGRLRLRVPRIPGVEGWVRSDWTVGGATHRSFKALVGGEKVV